MSPETRTPAPGVTASSILWPKQKCAATRTNGEPCSKYAIRGGWVCDTHGGRAPQVKAAARRRLEALIPMATDILAELANGHAMDPGTDAAICVPPAVRARACAEILSRAGIPVTSEIDLAVSESTNAGLDARITAALDARSPAVPVPETQEAR